MIADDIKATHEVLSDALAQAESDAADSGDYTVRDFLLEADDSLADALQAVSPKN